MPLSVPFVLASASPRRRDLLPLLGHPFEVVPADVDETAPEGIEPSALVRHLAMEKAAAVSRTHPDALVLGADTVVVLDGEVLGKPSGPDEASDMLERLSGRRHTVVSGLALVHAASGRRHEAHEAVDVFFGELTPAQIADYVASGSPLDKAGAYGIQDDRGALFVRRIEGDYYAVVGLPLFGLHRLLTNHFSDLVRP
jgi:septum formation protein